jgi:aminoglycoside 3-N-acetyltransferase
MVSFREFIHGFQELNLPRPRPVILHASLSSFVEVRGGAETVLGALLTMVDALIVPTFTYKTMLIPETGPEDNAIVYGSGREQNRSTLMFRPDMPADPLMGIIPETVRLRPQVQRSIHPILSFAGINVEAALQAQTMEQPLEPFRVLVEQAGWVLLLGVNHTVNTGIHYAEKLAGRKQFQRWALTTRGVRGCPGFPGCSFGFERVSAHLVRFTRWVKIGQAAVQAIPLQPMIDTITNLLHRDPLALLCSQADCERCNAVRKSVKLEHGT